MNLTVVPGGPLRGVVELPGDKSLSHRALLFSAMAEGRSEIRHVLESGVTRVLMEALPRLGVVLESSGDGTWRIQSPGWSAWTAPAEPLHCGNSATTLRLLAGALAAAGRPAVLTGSPGLCARPMGRIVEPLRRMGVDIRAAAGDRAPLELAGRPAGTALKGMDYTLAVASAQVKSCLLLAGLAAAGRTILREPGPSRDHTERMLSAMGVRIVAGPETGVVTLEPPAGPLLPLTMTLPGDFSSAAFLLVAAAVTPGSGLLLRNVGLNPTRTGLLEALRAMGADLRIENERMESGEPVGDVLVNYAPLTATQIRGDLVVRMIDEFPAFAVAALHATGRTEVRDAAELRGKESDRISVLAGELRALGAVVEEFDDGFALEGPMRLTGTAAARGDHRLAMSLALTGLSGAGPVTVQGAEMMAESFPAFTETLTRLGANLYPNPS